MTSARNSVPDARRSRLLGAVAAIEHEISLLEREISLLAAEGANDNGASAADDLRASIADLAQTKLTPSAGRDGVVG